ncbi:O-antigen ligase family protein [Bradyrhizobium sp. GM2.2]|uniref:O-antigen ligase family protein n=1 Tax=Bradyrhizobium sp. GM2.2 TaxID=3156358 RepID=UPI003396421B
MLISSVPLTILVAGVLGNTRNPAITAALLGGPIIGLLGFSRWSNFERNEVDLFFCAFAITAIASIVANGLPPPKSLSLFALSLMAYPACRFGPRRREPGAFIVITSIIVLIGTVVSAVALISQWNDGHGKPLVFGLFDHAAAAFLFSLAILVIALVVENTLTPKKATFVAIAITIPTAVFAAAQVRFTFVALGLALAQCWLIVSKQQRFYVLAIVGAVVLSTFVGLISRQNVSARFLYQAVAPVPSPPVPETIAKSLEGSADPGTIANTAAARRMGVRLTHSDRECEEKDNSISMRRTLISESLQIIPSAGLFGIGLSSFAGISCLTRDPHNSILQAAVEFGPLGGLFLTLTILSVVRRLWMIRDHGSSEVNFVLCTFTFIAIMDMAHGHLINEILLFALAGYGSQLIGLARKGVLA